MSTRKIASCLNVRVNLGNFQHIEFTQYSEEEINYVNDAERVAKEDSLNKDLADSIVRGLRALPDRVSKGAVEVAEFEELVRAGIPQWLVNNPIPNIANKAKKLEVAVQGDAKQNLDEVVSEVALIEGDVASSTKPANPVGASTDLVERSTKAERDQLRQMELLNDSKKKEVDLFEANIDAGATSKAPVTSPVTPAIETKSSKADDDFDEMFN